MLLLDRGILIGRKESEHTVRTREETWAGFTVGRISIQILLAAAAAEQQADSGQNR